MVWGWWQARQAQRERERELTLRALEGLEKVALAQAAALGEWSKALKSYFDSFQVGGVNRSWAHTDLSEAQREREQMLVEPDPLPEPLQDLTSERQRLQWLVNELDG